MSQFGDWTAQAESTRTGDPANLLLETAGSLYREAEMIGLGVGGAVLETVKNPLPKLPELGASLAIGSGLGIVSRLGAPGKAIAAGIGTAMMFKFGYDELTGNRWSNFGRAVKDTWMSADNMDRNIAVTKNSLGSFVVDTGIGWAGMKGSSLAMSRFAPPRLLVKDAIRRADADGGAALRGLQDRWENANRFQKIAEGKLEVITHSQPAVPGAARGDLVRVASTPDGQLLLTAMDVQGHGVSAAKKAVRVHAAIDETLPKTSNKSGSDILGMIDEKLNYSDELSITAGLMKYDPKKHTLHTATAGSELAFVVRANGAVRQLDAKGEGMLLGSELYSMLPKGNEVIRLRKGDTVIMASDGVFDRFGYGSAKGFGAFLKRVGPRLQEISRRILDTPPPATGVDDTSFIIFRPAT